MPDNASGHSPARTDRRAWFRPECDLAVSVRLSGSANPLTARATDVSVYGLGLRLAVPLPTGTACTVAVDLPDGAALTDLSGWVIWSGPAPDGERPAHLAGVTFDDLTPQQREALTAAVDCLTAGMIERMRTATAGLVRVSRFLDDFTDLHVLLERIMDEAKGLTDAEASSLLLWDAEEEELFFEVALGEQGEGVKRVRLALGEGVAGTAAVSLKPVNVPDVTRDSRWFSDADTVSGFETRSILAAPMFRRDRLVGVLEVLNRRGGGGFSEADEANLMVLAGEAAMVIENARLHREKLEAQRLAAIGHAVAELAHCIKNILNGIQGGAYVVDAGLTRDDPAKVSKGWDMVKRNNAFLSDLVLDMLAYAKEREPLYEETDLNDLATTVAGLLKERAASRGIEATADTDDGLGPVRADRTGIYRVLLNLGTNAVDACEEGSGRVCLRAKRDHEGWAALEVEDNGSGIAPEHRERLFTEFFSTKGAKGTGLGLAVCDKIVREHGGRMDVASEVGQGTTFTIRLPVAGKDASADTG